MKKYFGFSRNVFVLSLVSFLNDIGGETIKRTIPLFLTNVLGVKTTVVGLVEGVGEATPQLLQPFSGLLSDKFKKRKIFVLLGQILRSSMLFLLFVSSWWQVLLIRFLDRSGKGLATSPRDALLSLSTSKNHEGQAFGLNRALDNAGAVIGLLLAGVLVLFYQKGGLFLTGKTFSLIILLAAIPLLLAFLLILSFVKDAVLNHQHSLKLKDRPNPSFYKFLGVSFLFALGNSSDGFLILRAQNLGASLASIFFLLAAFSLVSSFVSLPAGSLSDKIGRKKILISGWFLYSLIYFGFAKASFWWQTIFLFLIYGFYHGLSEGTAKAYVADLVGEGKRGIAYGFYNLVVGATLLPASLLAGFFWQMISPAAPFYFGSLMSFLAVIFLLFL